MLPNPAADVVDDVSLVDELEVGEELAAPLAQDTVVQDDNRDLISRPKTFGNVRSWERIALPVGRTEEMEEVQVSS